MWKSHVPVSVFVRQHQRDRGAGRTDSRTSVLCMTDQTDTLLKEYLDTLLTNTAETTLKEKDRTGLRDSSGQLNISHFKSSVILFITLSLLF